MEAELSKLPGYQWDERLIVSTDTYGGRGLFLTSAVDEGTVGAIWTSRAAMEHPAVVKVANSLGSDAELPDRLSLLLALLYGRLAPTESPMLGTYVQQLPDRIGSSPLLFTIDELSLLAGTKFVASVRAKLKKLLREYEFLLPAIQAAWDMTPSLGDYVWSDTVYRSRVFKGPFGGDDVEEQEALIPQMDFCNCTTTEKADLRWFLDADLNALFIANHPLKIGEVLTSYGDHSNEELLFQYGFVLEANPRDVAWLILPLAGDDPLAEHKIMLLQMWSCGPQIKVGANGVDPASFRAAMAAVMVEDDFGVLADMDEEQVVELQHISKENTDRAHELIRQAAKDALDALTSNTEGDVAAIAEDLPEPLVEWLESNTASDGERAARRAIISSYLDGQRRILQNFLSSSP